MPGIRHPDHGGRDPQSFEHDVPDARGVNPINEGETGNRLGAAKVQEGNARQNQVGYSEAEYIVLEMINRNLIEPSIAGPYQISSEFCRKILEKMETFGRATITSPSFTVRMALLDCVLDLYDRNMSEIVIEIVDVLESTIKED